MSALTCSRLKRGQKNQALGHSRGGFGTKVHALSDTLGNPMQFILTGGEASDFPQACPFLEGKKACDVLVDRGYDADYIVTKIQAMGTEAVFPPRSLRKISHSYNPALYKERNAIERMFGKHEAFS